MEKVHTIGVKADEFKRECDELIKAVGKENVYALFITPCTYTHAVNTRLRGITVVVREDTPISHDVLYTTLGTGTSAYELNGMADGSEIDLSRLRGRIHVFNACAPDSCSPESRFRLFNYLETGEVEVAGLHNWEASLGTDWADKIEIARIYNTEKRGYSWVMFVTSGLEYSAEELINYAEKKGWTFQKFYKSMEYKHFMRACAVNRNRLAYAAAKSLDLYLVNSTYERSITLNDVNCLRPRYSSIHHTIVEKNLGKDAGGIAYAVHIETYPLHCYKRICFRRGDTEMMMTLAPRSGNQGRDSWRNEYANSFPHNCGYRSHEQLRSMMEKRTTESVYGDEHCMKRWKSPIPYNLATIREANRPYSDVEDGLARMGMGPNWEIQMYEVVMMKVASMDEYRLTAFELLHTYDRETKLIRVPIRSKIFAGGDDYTSFWYVYNRQDPPPHEMFKYSGMPMYVEAHRDFIRRVAIANGEIDETYSFDDEQSDDAEYSDSCSFSDAESEYDEEEPLVV